MSLLFLGGADFEDDMNWDAIGAFGELFGGLVVMVSVVYLALQVRQTNRHAQASAEVDWMDGWNRVLNDWVTDETTISALRAGFHDFDGSSKSEQAVFHMRVGALVNHWLLAGQLRDKGLLPEDVYQAATDFLVAVLSTEGGRQYWERDAEATPNGLYLLELINSDSQTLPPLTDMMPWWSADEAEECLDQPSS